MLIELAVASLLNAYNLAMLINETRRAKRSMPELKTPRGSILRMTQTALTSPRTSGRTDQGKFTTYFTRNLAEDSRLTLDYCAELVTNAFRLTPSARRKDSADSLLAGGSAACLVHYNGMSKHFWRGKLNA